jgi:outer membrane protein OmpA-like peptidoglycan-associated protein
MPLPKKVFSVWLGLLLLFLSAQNGFASKEHPYIRPIPGFTLYDSEFKNFASFTFKIEERDGTVTKREVQGKTWELIYEVARGDYEFSRLEIIENYRREAMAKGGSVLSMDEVLLDFRVPLPEGGSAWAHLYTANNYYELTIVNQEGFKKQLTFSAREMKDKLDTQGRVAIYGIHFDFDKADLKPGSEKVLLEMVKLMKDNPGLKVEVQGHTDNVGQRAYNRQLSERRAMTVRSFLSLYGIDPERMTVRGFGAERPVADNRTEEGRALNRRVELKKL